MPAALSTKVVVLEVPKMAPIEVAVASAKSALSILDLKPAVVSIAFSSSSLKMPARRPVPIKVPMVSKVSERLKEKMVISTSGSLETSVKREGRPAEVKIAPKVVGSCWQASVKLTVSCGLVTCMGMPIRAVATMPMRIAPLTFKTSRTMVSAQPDPGKAKILACSGLPERGRRNQR